MKILDPSCVGLFAGIFEQLFYFVMFRTGSCIAFLHMPNFRVYYMRCLVSVCESAIVAWCTYPKARRCWFLCRKNGHAQEKGTK